MKKKTTKYKSFKVGYEPNYFSLLRCKHESVSPKLVFGKPFIMKMLLICSKCGKSMTKGGE